jgi:hypothetical protein
MDILRQLIVERTSCEFQVGERWSLDVYFYLIGHGVKPDNAIAAMTEFVDDVIAFKAIANNEDGAIR